MAFQWSLAALETLMAEDQMDQHAAVLRAFSVVELWRLRRVCRAFHRWGTAALAALPRVVAVGGADASVEVLDLSTLRWSSGAVPGLPARHQVHSVCGFGNALPSTPPVPASRRPTPTECCACPEFAAFVPTSHPDGTLRLPRGRGRRRRRP